MAFDWLVWLNDRVSYCLRDCQYIALQWSWLWMCQNVDLVCGSQFTYFFSSDLEEILSSVTSPCFSIVHVDISIFWRYLKLNNKVVWNCAIICTFLHAPKVNIASSGYITRSSALCFIPALVGSQSPSLIMKLYRHRGLANILWVRHVSLCQVQTLSFYK